MRPNGKMNTRNLTLVRIAPFITFPNCNLLIGGEVRLLRLLIAISASYTGDTGTRGRAKGGSRSPLDFKHAFFLIFSAC